MEDLWGLQGPAAVIALTLLFTLIIVVLALWIALPFAVFGIKSLLRDILDAQRETSKKLDQTRSVLNELNQRIAVREIRGQEDGFL